MRALILTASVGAGHDLPAERMAEALRARGVEAEIEDAVNHAGPLARRIILGGTNYDSRVGNIVFDVLHRAVSEWRPTHRLLARGIERVFRKRMERLVGERRPDVVISVYPASTHVIGASRLRGRIEPPLVAVITDLASLRFWAHPGADLHLTIHPESEAEVRAIAGQKTTVQAVYGFSLEAFGAPPSVAVARERLGLSIDGRLVVVSGGGWGVGDAEGAAASALTSGADHVVVLCGYNDTARQAVTSRFAGDARVQAWGFTDRMPEVLAAADVLVHATAGLTMLEAMMSGCSIVSYGWGVGHIRANNRAYERFGLASVAPDRTALERILTRLLAQPRPTPWQPELPDAVDLVIDLAEGRLPRVV